MLLWYIIFRNGDLLNVIQKVCEKQIEKVDALHSTVKEIELKKSK